MKAMALSRAIYIFTIVTIFYTPLGFMATLWALPVLNTTADGESIHPSLPTIVNTFVMIPLLTYILCGLLAWYHRSDRASKHLKGARGKLVGFLSVARTRFSDLMRRPSRKDEANRSENELENSQSV
ncbi:hypothetical protein F5883DRAFT_97600 [Diaporthe sp. PMI_573]|nr:hypothetical protein F5883DRAFT_97600 [Diaporthaceae sp. PMI_573]